MNTPTTYTPYFLSLSLALVFAAMMAVSQQYTDNDYVTISYETGERLNQPGPRQSRKAAIKLEEGNPVFLKEDLRDEVINDVVRLQVNNNTTSTEQSWMEERIAIESNDIIAGERYLVLGGTYTDDMILLSKQAQYENKGFVAQIIRFHGKQKRHICLGRFEEEAEAKSFAEKAAANLDIKTHILDKR